MENICPHKILVIDDEQGVLSVLEAMLVRQGFEVHTAHCGELGIQKVQCHPYDIVITDLKMPGMSGTEVLEHIKAIKEDGPPVVAMSGTPWLKGDSDFDGMLIKPFTRKTLLEMIQTLVPSFQD